MISGYYPEMSSGLRRILAFHQPLLNTRIAKQRHIHSSTSRLYQNMGFDRSNESSAISDDDPLKWEKLYSSSTSPPLPTDTQQPIDEQQFNLDDNTNTIVDTTTATTSEIRVITFDLDNTIWKTMATISEANDVLANHLHDKFGIEVEVRSEKMMGQLFKEHPNRYAGVDFANDIDNTKSDNSYGKNDYANIVQNVGHTDFLPEDTSNGVHIQSKAKQKPVYLTVLRKDSIRKLILETNDSSTATAAGLTALEIEDQVNAAFEIWVDARCNSISNNFAPLAVETLRELKSQYPYIGAITDGNSDPNRVRELAGIFDFVIRAEDVGVSKPDKRVYKAATAALMMKIVQDGKSVEEFFLGEKINDDVATDTYISSQGTTSPSWKDVDDDAVEAFLEAVGPWWVHIGDDFFKDVVAAKESQMRTVWTTELVGGSSIKGEDEKKKEQTQRSVNDLVGDVSKSNGVLKMAIGPSEFLSESLQDEFCDATLDKFGDLSDLLMQWHIDGKAAKQNECDDDDTKILPDMKQLDINDMPPPVIEPVSSSTAGVVDTSDNKASTKFCVFCGEKLPRAAMFCSSCGEKQI